MLTFLFVRAPEVAIYYKIWKTEEISASKIVLYLLSEFTSPTGEPPNSPLVEPETSITIHMLHGGSKPDFITLPETHESDCPVCSPVVGVNF